MGGVIAMPRVKTLDELHADHLRFKRNQAIVKTISKFIVGLNLIIAAIFIPFMAMHYFLKVWYGLPILLSAWIIAAVGIGAGAWTVADAITNRPKQ